MRTTNKQVKELIKQHILSYYTIEELKEQVNYMRYNNLSNYNLLQEMAQGGCFLIYYGEVKDFLNGLGINPINKEYEDGKSWELYKHLIALNGQEILKGVK